MSRAIEVQGDGPCVFITLNRPERRNALTAESRDLLIEAVTEAGRSPACRAIILTGAGGSFCAGGDMSAWRADDPSMTDHDAGRARVAATQVLLRALVESPKPLIAAVEGDAYGAGFSLALACDHIVAASSARFCASFVRVGLMADMGLTWTLSQRVGPARAKQLIMLARVVKAPDALELGLVDELTEAGGALAGAKALAAQYASSAPLAVSATKQVFAKGVGALSEVLDDEREQQATLFRTADHRRAIEAFLEKRKPAFEGS